MTLVEHKNPSVRADSIMALVTKTPKLAEQVSAKHQNDLEEITIVLGCFGEKRTVAEFMKSKGPTIGRPFGFW